MKIIGEWKITELVYTNITVPRLTLRNAYLHFNYFYLLVYWRDVVSKSNPEKPLLSIMKIVNLGEQMVSESLANLAKPLLKIFP